jgi:hypothetical protein
MQAVQTWLVGQLRQTAHWLTKVGSAGKKGLSRDSSGLNTQTIYWETCWGKLIFFFNALPVAQAGCFCSSSAARVFNCIFC